MTDQDNLRKVPLRRRYELFRQKQERVEVKERAGFVPPASVEEGRSQLTSLRAEMEIVKGDLQGKTAEDFPDEGKFRTWKTSAQLALGRMKARQILLQDWLKEREVD